MKSDAHPGWLRVFDYFFILRPMLFFPGWSTLLAGYLINKKSRVIYLTHLTVDVWILLAAFALFMGSAFILNQIRDAEGDRVNKKLFMISDGIISKKTALTESVILILIAIILGFLINLIVGIVFMLFFIITGILYNFKPAILKDRPWGSLTANAVMGWLAFASGWCAHYGLSTDLVIDSLPYLFFNTSLYLFTLLPDVEGDLKINKRTLAVLYGPKKMIISAFLLYMSGFAIAMVLADYMALFVHICSFPFFIFTISTFRIESAVQTTKYGILFFAVGICLRWPLYFPIMLAGFFLTKLYYHLRFDFNYPRFTG
jgi:4-hydroxybenzoate polyprenyltransferase